MASTDHLQRKKHMLQVVAWLRENYKVGKSGSTSKNAVYQHYSDMCSERGIEPSINATYFGKLVKRAFPGVQYNRKGPRGNSLQHYTHLKRINHEKLKQQRLVEEASRAVETCGVPEEEALYRLMREKYAEMFAPLAAGLDVARAPHHYAAAPLHPVAAALLAADGGGGHPSTTSYARPTRTGLLSPGDATLHGDPRFRVAAASSSSSSLHSSGASDPDGATGSESPASGSPSLPPPTSSSSSSSVAGALGSRFLSSSLSISTGASPPAGAPYAHLAHPQQQQPYHHHQHQHQQHHHQAGKASSPGFPSSSAHYVVSSSPPSSPGSGHHPGGGGAYAPPGHGHGGAFGPPAFAYPPTCPYCHHCLHCYYSGGGGGGGGHVNAYAPSPHPAGPSSAAAAAAAAAAAHLVTAKEASVLAQWVRERPFLPPISAHGAPSAPRSADSTSVVDDDDDDDDDGRGRRDETDETHSHRRESARAQGPGGRVAGQW